MNVNQERMRLFEIDLNNSFELHELQIEDESHLHAGHAGAASGGGHFKITLVSPQFKGQNAVARHRSVYAALQRHIPGEIHALIIKALTPEEVLS